MSEENTGRPLNTDDGQQPEEIISPEENNVPATGEPQTQSEGESIRAGINDKLQTENSKQKTEQMEVHKHPHHVTHKKKWGEYLLEFMMLFLAVFLGFIAENIREHQVEKEREKQYMESFISDLENDTANLNLGFQLKDQRINAIDSVFLYFEMNPGVTKITGITYRQLQRTTWDRSYTRNSTTIDQLRNAGGMRLIRKKIIADSIAAYDLQWQRANYWREGYTRLQEIGRAYLVSIIDAQGLLPVYRNHHELTAVTPTETDRFTFSMNRTKLNDYLNFLFIQKINTGQDKRGYMALEKSAEQLITLIKKEYQLD